MFGVNDLVAVDGEVVVDAEDFDAGREIAEVVEVGVPSFGRVAAGVLVFEGFWRVDVEVPSAPEAAAWIVLVRCGCRCERSPPCRVTRTGVLHLVGVCGALYAVRCWTDLARGAARRARVVVERSARCLLVSKGDGC